MVSSKNEENQTGQDASAAPQNLEDIFMDTRSSLQSVCSKYLNRPEDIEDVVQETFVKTLKANKKSHIRSLKAYLLTTARNLSLKHRALHANKLTDYVQDLGLLEVLKDVPLETKVEAHEQFGIFCAAVRELPLQCRRVFILKKIYGLSHEEIADRLGITVGTTTAHLAKGAARCALYMEENGYLVKPDARRKTIHDSKK